MPTNAINDAFVKGAYHHTGTTDWTDLTSASFADQSKPAGGGALLPAAADLPFALVLVDMIGSTDDAFIKTSARDTAVDTTTNTIRVPAGTSMSLGIRGLQGTGNANVKTIAVKLADASDTAYITVDLDRGN